MSSKTLLRILSSVMIVSMLLALAVSSAPAIAQSPSSPVQAVNKGHNFSIDTVYSEGSLKNAIQLADGRLSVIVQLAEPPLALYAGNVSGLKATAPQSIGRVKLDPTSQDSQAYVQHLVDAQDVFIKQLAVTAPSATVAYTYQAAFNGISMKVAKKDIARIAMMSGVVKIYPDQIREVQMDASLPLIKAQALWTKLGGQSNAGHGIKVADVDTGLDVKNPMFSGAGFTAPAGYPKGFCVTNPADPDFKCNGKVIVGRYYYDPALVGGTTILNPAEVMTPFGIDSHGTHTAGTITGRPVTANISGISRDISGVAPAAYLMVYKALFSVIRSGTETGSGSDTMLVAALNAALLDGADVINNSWGGGAGDPNTSIYKPLIGAITAAGTLVVFSAGNSGPGGGTIGCPGCVEDALTVAASTTNRTFSTTLVEKSVSDGTITVPPAVQSITGRSLIGAPLQAQIVDLRVEGVADTIACTTTLPSVPLTGKIVVVERGVCALVDKVTHVAAAGGVGVVIRNVAGGSSTLPLIQPVLPTIHISRADGDALFAFLTTVKSKAATATFQINGPAVADLTDQADVIASFSSVGPNGDQNVLKPDITAPGVNILSASSPAIIPGATEPWYEFLQGTSMAAPHITGSAALLKQQHPDWTPWQIRTALTSTAVQTLVGPDGVTPANPFQMGSGRVDLDRASNAGLTFNKSSFANSTCMLTCSWTVNVKNVTSEDATWTAVATPDKPMTLKVTPASVDLQPGTGMDVTVTADVSQVLPGNYVFGSVVWKNAAGTYTDAYLPVAVASGKSTNAAILSETVSKANSNAGDELTYSINVSNPYAAKTTFTVESPLSTNLAYTAASATGGLTYDSGTRKLSGQATLDPFSMDVTPTGTPTNYVAGDPVSSLDLTANCPAADTTCDEVVFTITGMDFWYLGVHYTSIKVSSNGFMAPGGTAITSAANPQQLPNAGAPNNVIAPLWSDLEFAKTGAKWLIWGTATDTVIEWQNANAFGNTSVLYNFEIWIKDTTNQITFAYGPLNADVATPGGLYFYSVGVENVNGTAGKSYYYYNGIGSPQGTAPVTGTDLNVVNNLFSASMTFKAIVSANPPTLPVVANLVTEVSNFDSQMNKALAYTTVKIYQINMPVLTK